MTTTVVLELQRDEAIALEAEARITLEGIDQLPNPSVEALQCRERIARAHHKLRTVLDEQERTLWG